ncbi:cystathionine gamma-synthase [Streptomyces sp. NPDC003077]|uniref:cystathionine gamma-synthase n=1 Tax=Streptomyces sp. NPDC003077 TaxID=3154443 RepID=UPI0033BDC565
MSLPHGFATLSIHAGQEPDPATGAVVPPLYQVSTFKQDGLDVTRAGYEYSRVANPTRSALEECVATLEGGHSGHAFGSGLAAEDALLRAVCRPGDHVLLPSDLYGGTHRLVTGILEPWGLTHSTVPMDDLDAVRAALRPETRLVWCETPTNPYLGIVDIAALAEITIASGVLLAVDNTLASPWLQRPLDLGADLVVHSTSKYLGGHSDVIGGVVVAQDPGIGARLAALQSVAGAIAGPFDAWLTLRGIKTLVVRMEAHCDNAEQIADMLATHPQVSEVFYPGLPGHPGHRTAAKQMRRFGGMVSFRVRGGREAAAELCSRTELFSLGVSLGGVESLITHPASMTHTSLNGTEQEIPGDLLRLSVGIESTGDLLEDLRRALG